MKQITTSNIARHFSEVSGIGFNCLHCGHFVRGGTIEASWHLEACAMAKADICQCDCHDSSLVDEFSHEGDLQCCSSCPTCGTSVTEDRINVHRVTQHNAMMILSHR